MQYGIGILLLCFSGVAYGILPILGRFAYAANTDPTTLLLIRYSMAAPFLLICMAFRKRALPDRKTSGIIVILGMVFYAGASLCYFAAITRATVAQVAILIYLYPILVAFIATLVFHDPITRPKIIALLLSLAGSFAIIGIEGGGDPIGMLLSLMGALFTALYLVISGRIASKVDPFTYSSILVTGAAITFGAIACAQGMQLPESKTGWMAIIVISLVSTVMAITASFAGLKRIGATNASLISTLELPVSVVLAGLVLGESITLLKSIGGCMILGAVLVLAKYGPQGSQWKRPAFLWKRV